MFIELTGEVFWDFCETKGVLIWSPLPRRGAKLLMFWVSTCRLQICCILLQVMATNVMGPALLTKACFFFDGLKIWLQKALEFHLWQLLAHIQWWILGMFNTIKHWYNTTVLHGSFFCKNAWMRSWLHRHFSAELTCGCRPWICCETGNRRCTHSYELLQRKSRVRCSCQCVFRRISAYLNMCNKYKDMFVGF